MDTREENRRRLASSIVIITSVLLCSVASWLFTGAGADFGGGIIGIVLGPVPGLILALIFLKVYKPE